MFGTILLGIAMTDAREYIIPDEFTWGGLVIGLLFSLAGGLAGLGTAVLGAVVGFGLLWLVGTVGTWVFKEDAMGGGDIKMMAMVGAFVGWQGVLLTIFLGALAGSLVFVPLLLMGQKKLVPFGIFLAIGAAIAYEVGPAIDRLVRPVPDRRMRRVLAGPRLARGRPAAWRAGANRPGSAGGRDDWSGWWTVSGRRSSAPPVSRSRAVPGSPSGPASRSGAT